ncbi:sensor histidine kinase [Microbacterium sp. P05]|uniref:sensor histidine kinase n=1 Tax=Microbacterium sp. P05 TaxID=3366948 RepID=UPI003745E6D7
MSSSARPTALADRLRSALPPLLVLAGAVGYIGIDFWVQEVPHSVPGDVSPLVHAGLVVLQAVALLMRLRSPLIVFGAVVFLDLVILATTAGELGIGALGVLFASYAMARHEPGRATWIALGAGAAATTLVGGVAMAAGSAEAPVVLIFTAVTRIVLLYAVPAGVADYVRGRGRLADALRDQARMAENEQRDRALRELHAERTALARELHDIAGHHLSGIIVSAQAATALTRNDPERARAMMQTVQDEARTTLADLRRTVGLLRNDDDPQSPGGPSPTPAIAGVAALVEAARERGQHIEFNVVGEARALGPLAETAAYRMVQESLANAARHASGAVCRVSVRFGADAVELTVANEPGPDQPARGGARSRQGFGLSGMAERAALIGADLVAAPTPDGGWLNRLTIPTDGRSDT